MLLKIDRYIGRAFVGSYLICLTGVIGMYVILDVFSRFDDFADTERPLLMIGAYYAMTTPLTFLQVSHFLPVMAAMFTVTRLSRNNEFIPIKASGISVYRALLPVFVLSCVAAVLCVANQELLIPSIAEKVTGVKRTVRGNKEVEQILLTDALGRSLFVRRYDALKQKMEAVNFASYYPNGRIETDYIASEASWVGTARRPEWKLLGVTVYRYDENTGEPLDENNDGVNDYPRRHDWVIIKTSLTPADLESKELHNEFLTFADLKVRAGRYPHMPQIRIQLHQRFTVPIGAVVLLLIGLPFVFCQESKSLFLGIGICLLVCAAFFVTSFVFQDLGNKRFIQPILASWSPIVLFGCAGVCLFFGAIRT